MSTKNYQFNNNQTSDGTSVTSNTVNEDKPNSKGGWTKVEDALLKRRDMDSTQKLILSILTRLSVKEGFAWVSVIGLASMIGMTEKATRRAINQPTGNGGTSRTDRALSEKPPDNEPMACPCPARPHSPSTPWR
jgi:hypothetical protein